MTTCRKGHHDRFESVAKRDFKAVLIRLLEQECKFPSSRRILIILAYDLDQLHKGYFPGPNRLGVGDIVWQATNDDGQRQSNGKTTGENALQTVVLPLLRK
jgi:hypothetical protein